MNDIALSDPRLILLPKAFQGLYGISLAGLNFNRIHFVFQLTVVGNKKIYFNIVSVLFSVVMCIEIQLVTVCRQHLSNGVLVKHTLIHVQLVTEYLLVDLIFKQFVLIECVAYEQPSVTEITLYITSVFVDRQPNIRIVA